MVEYLVDRAKKLKSVENIITDLKIENKITQVKINNSWKELIELSLHNIKGQNIDKVLDSYEKELNVNFSHEIRNRLKNIQNSIEEAWDSDANKFKVSYTYNSHNQLHQLIVPIRTSEVEDIVIKEIYDKNGNFTAQEFEKEICVDLYKLESYDLYVSTLKSDEIYKKENNSFINRLNKNLNENKESNLSNTMEFVLFGAFCLFTASPAMILYVLNFNLIIVLFYGLFLSTPLIIAMILSVKIFTWELIRTLFITKNNYICLN